MTVELPEGWREVALSDEAQIVSGATPKTTVAEYWGGDIAWLTPDDLSKNRGKVVSGGNRFLTEAGYKSCSTRIVPKGSVLFTSRAPIGYVAIAGSEVCTNQGFKSAVPSANLNNEYLYYYLKFATPEIKSRANGTTFLEISAKGFAATPLLLPPLSEQQRIVEILEEQFSRLDAALSSIKAVREKAQAFRRSLLHAAFTGELTGGTEGWREVALGEVASFAPKAKELSVTEETLLSFVPMKAVPEVTGSVDLSETITLAEGVRRNLTYFREGDIIFAKITPCMENGKIALARNLFNGAAFGSTEFHVLRPLGELVGEYLRLFLSSEDFRADAAQSMTGAVGQRRVPKKYLESALLPLPPLPEQQLIVEILEEQFSRLDNALQIADQLEARIASERRSLLHSAFTGALTAQWRKNQ